MTNTASAAIYRWIPGSGATIADDVTTDWGSCGTNPATNRTTLLSNSSTSGCSSDSITSGIPDPVGETYPMVEMFFNTSYSQDTDVTGNWYFGRINNAGVTPTTYTFYLVYVFPNGTKVTLPGTGSLTVSSSTDLNYNISLAAINGIIPKNAKPGMKITKSVQWDRYLWFGDAAGKGGAASGYFSVTETVPGAQTFNVSGYVTNRSSGLPLEGAAVQTNTGFSAITDSQGYYLFTGLSNGSYIIDASLSGYITDSTTAAISGANKNNVNISLSPVPKYLLSGYVKDLSTGDPISDIVVTTDTDLVTTTNATGYYSFLVNNGTYFIIASKSGYHDGFIERTVNGAAASNSNISLASILPTVGKILVATNRYVILDDWTTASSNGPGFFKPTTTHSANSWTGINTKINATALLMDDKGLPLTGRIITFNLYMPNGTEYTAAKINATTDAYGLASFSFDMNARNYYGNWTVKASNGSFYDNASFIYNWWGCGISGCSSGHTSRNPTGSQPQNSPYLSGRETLSGSSSHNTNCTNCHQSFDGKPGGLTTGGSNHTNYASDVHRNIACNNTGCHISSWHSTSNAVIGSCYSAACHRPLGTPANRSDISNKSTLNSAGLSLYSWNNGSAFNSTFHTPNSTVPCFTCHGPMHNITKPDETLRFMKNNDTESSHCTVCHTSHNKHNASNITSGGLNCTLCHSDDIHAIAVLGQDGSYVTYNKIYPNTTGGNCTNCHQNATYFNTLKSQPKAGNYTGRNPVVIRNPQLHSDAYDAGIRYGNYWWVQNQDASCRYCHGSSMHDPVGLGRPSVFMGKNTVNSTIGNTTWCASCHYPDYAEYSNMTGAFITDGKSVPPSIIKGSNYFIKGRDHSIDPGFNDSNCYTCHNGSTPYTRITPFMHDVYIGGGGPDCLSCHEIGSTRSVLHVNNSAMELSIHANLNNKSLNLYGVPAENKKCWGCHQTDGTQPGNTSMGDRFSSPYTCYDCHKNDGKPYQNVENAGSVTNHIDIDSIITRIYTHNATCTTCHNNSVHLNDAKITDPRIVSEKESVSHYGSTSSLVESIGDSGLEGCIYCHYNISNSAKWGKAHDPRLNPVLPHTATKNSQCYICHIQGTLPADFHSESMYYAGNGKIIVATNRYVILDDDIATGAKAQSESGFRVPLRVYSSQNYWSGKNTRINATALFIDRYGAPQSGTAVSFTIYWPNGTALTTINDTTNSNGLANFSFDMNNRNYYGNWKIRASSGSIGSNTTFIYNWWGCAFNSGPCNEGHGGENPGSRGIVNSNSPYMSGRERITGEGDHYAVSGMNCTICHQSYDGKPGDSNPTSGSDPNHLNKPSDVHRNISCDNANCHGNKAQHDTNQRINSCYNASCHNRLDISRKGTLNGSNPDTALSIYSYNNASSFNSTFHTPNSTVPCIICHGPMHSITKADATHRFIKNNDTEYNNCISCHQDYVRHNSSVNCPVCHSDDVHSIKVLAQNATYVTMNHNDPNPKRGNCSNCHQNSSFFGILLSQPAAGNYTGRYSPIVRSPVNHSEDSRAGSIWTDEGYWIKNDQVSWCDYCHNNEMHAMSTLGKIKMFRGDNIVNSTIGNTSWCASCHWQGYSNDSTKYLDMVDTFTGYFLPVPPEITGHAIYAPTGKPGYFNHTLSGYSDGDCAPCHGISLGENARITEFIHNTRKGQSGGQNCTSCHNIGGSAKHDVDIASMNNSAHANLNNMSQYTGGNVTNRKCWACHGTLNSNGFANESNQPVGTHNQSKYQTPRECPDCHTNIQSTTNFSAPQVKEHRDGAPMIQTNGTLCSLCHNNGLTSITETDGFGVTSPQNATASHYLKDANTNLMTTSNHSNDCRWCHITNSANASWGTPFHPGGSSKYAHASSNVDQNEDCYSCHGGLTSSVKLHDTGIAGGAAGDDCLGCHMQDIPPYPGINISLFTNHKNVNVTNSVNVLDNNDCMTCHYNTSNMSDVLTRSCSDCHTSGTYGAPIISNHKTGGINISATAYCSTCHNNSVNKYNYSNNASVSHYGANSSLVKPTVNLTSMPVFGFATQAGASAYNAPCNSCHNPPNMSYGTPTNIAQPHIRTAACNKCHMGADADNLHNISLMMPNTNSCKDCHTIYASEYDAPNLTGTTMGSSYTSNQCEQCHWGNGDNYNGRLDSLTEHNNDRTQNPVNIGSTDTVSLNGQTDLTVIRGTFVTVTSRVNDMPNRQASRVKGAEYYIDINPGSGLGIPMNAVDGYYNAAMGAWENVTGTIDTSGLSSGNHTIYVRGMDIGKQWTPPRNATLIVQSLGYINGTVISGGSGIAGAIVSTTGTGNITGSDGNYSLRVPAGTYNITASKQPEYHDNATSDVVVDTSNTTILNIVLGKKPIGNITGVVRNA